MLSISEIQRKISKDTTVFWFRRDLRLADNVGLFHALGKGNVVPVFIFDSVILDALEDKSDARVTFIVQTLDSLQTELEEFGSGLIIFHGNPIDFFKEVEPAEVIANEDYEPYARQRDGLVADILRSKGSKLTLYKDQVIMSPEEVLKDDGKPYTVFTPYSRKWKSKLTAGHLRGVPSEKGVGYVKMPPLPRIGIETLGFRPSTISVPPRKIPLKIISKYDQTRNFPGQNGTTRLGIHLRFGTVSIRKLAAIAREQNEVWLNELIWREFYFAILWHFPHVTLGSFKPDYDRIPWRNDPTEFEQWSRGMTGYPIVDAGMRELNETGYMHNRVRMITASFLCKHLLIDWRWGEAYFAAKLLDFDLSANNGGWQWAAGSGCDAAPYFRVFSPELQTQKFDPEGSYLRHWVPELKTTDYPKPMVEHAFARKRALETYSAALKG